MIDNLIVPFDKYLSDVSKWPPYKLALSTSPRIDLSLIDVCILQYHCVPRTSHVWATSTKPQELEIVYMYT